MGKVKKKQFLSNKKVLAGSRNIKKIYFEFYPTKLTTYIQTYTILNFFILSHSVINREISSSYFQQ